MKNNRLALGDPDFSTGQIAVIGNDLFEDTDLRRHLEIDPRAALEERGIDVPSDMELRVAVNTDDILYIAMPPDPNSVLSDENLGSVAGGTDNVSTAGSVGSMGTFACSCGPSSVSSVGSLGTAA